VENCLAFRQEKEYGHIKFLLSLNSVLQKSVVAFIWHNIPSFDDGSAAIVRGLLFFCFCLNKVGFLCKN